MDLLLLFPCKNAFGGSNRIIWKHYDFVFFVEGFGARVVDVDPVVFTWINVALKHKYVIFVLFRLDKVRPIDDKIVLIFVIEHEFSPLAQQFLKEGVVRLCQVGVLGVPLLVHYNLNHTLKHAFLIFNKSTHILVTIIFNFLIKMRLYHLKQC